MEPLEAPGPRRVAMVAAVGALALGALWVAGQSGDLARSPEDSIVVTVPPLVADEADADAAPPVRPVAAIDPGPDEWVVLPDSPLFARFGHGLVWTGSELVIWGGGLGSDELYADGAALDPIAGTWRELAPAPPGLGGRLWHSAVWTGTEMLVWGGTAHEGETTAGAAYDPVGDRWRRLAPAPLPALTLHTAVWTGTEMVVWGGTSGAGGVSAAGAAYNPARDAWRLLPEAPITGRMEHGAAWTGTEMIVWGGTSVPAGAPEADGAAYDPTADEWRRLPRTALEPRSNPTVVAIPGGVVVWSGDRVPGGDLPRGLRTGSMLATVAPGTWRQMRSSPFAGGGDFAGVWTGDMLLVWGHPARGPALGAAYRPPS